MKACFGLLFFCLAFTLHAQSDLNTALGKGDVAGISSYLGSKVELAIGQNEGTVTKAEAETRLKEFFASHAAKGFKAMHSGTSKSNDSTYSIGELTTANGTFRVYVLYTQQGSSKQVTELRIE